MIVHHIHRDRFNFTHAQDHPHDYLSHHAIVHRTVIAAVEYHFDHLEKLAHDVLGNGPADPAGAIGNLLQELVQETEKLRRSITARVFQLTKEKEIESFIRNCQSSLAALLDIMDEKSRPGKEKEEPAVQHFCKNILSLLTFIEERFSRYFDLDERMPAAYLSLTKREIKDKLDGLAGDALSAFEDDNKLARIIGALKDFAEKPLGAPVTYRESMYKKELLKEIQDIASWEDTRGMYSAVDRLVVYMNYNDKLYINQMANLFANEMAALGDLNDKIDRLLFRAKLLNQMQSKPDASLHPKHPSVKAQLGNWLMEELFYLEKKLGSLHAPRAARAKIVCHLSVDQIGVFIRAATETKAITADSQRALFSAVAPFLSTQHKREISADSMRSKSYSPEQRDLDALRDVLMRMYKEIGKY